MKLTKAQFCEYVNTYEEMIRESDRLAAEFGVGGTWKFDEWITNYYQMLTDMCELSEDPSFGTDLDWFCFETDFGKNEEMNKVYVKDCEWPWVIKDAGILYDFITREEQFRLFFF